MIRIVIIKSNGSTVGIDYCIDLEDARVEIEKVLKREGTGIDDTIIHKAFVFDTKTKRMIDIAVSEGRNFTFVENVTQY